MMKNKIRPDMKHTKAEAEMNQYEVENMANHMMKAEEIKADPKKHKAVMKHLKGKMKAIHSIEGLRAKRKDLQEEKSEPMDNAAEETGE